MKYIRDEEVVHKEYIPIAINWYCVRDFFL